MGRKIPQERGVRGGHGGTDLILGETAKRPPARRPLHGGHAPMSTAAVAAIKAAILALTDESTRKKIGWVLVAILSPIIVIVALIFFREIGRAHVLNSSHVSNSY